MTTAELAPPLETATDPPPVLALVPDACAEMEQVVRQCSLARAETSGRFSEAFVMAWGMRQLQELITDEMMGDIMALHSSRLGFRTDKDRNNGLYDVKTVKRCVIEAVFNGVDVVGNEFNIIAGNCYITKEGFQHKVRDLEGLTDLRLDIGIPRRAADSSGAIVPIKASWKMNGQADELTNNIPIKGDKYATVDSYRGKATRKGLKLVWEQATGSKQSIADGDVDDHEYVDVKAAEATPQNTNGKKMGFGKGQPPKQLPAEPANAAGAGSQEPVAGEEPTGDEPPATGDQVSAPPPPPEAPAEPEPPAPEPQTPDEEPDSERARENVPEQLE